MRSLLLLPVMAGAVFSQVPPDARDFIQHAASSLEAFRTGEIETENTGIYVRTGRPLTIKASLRWIGPDKVSLSIGSDTAGEISVSDGRTLTTYSKLSHQYSKRDGALSLSVAETRAMAGLLRLSASPDTVTAKILREEKLSVGRDQFTCVIVEAEVRPEQNPNEVRSYKLWIDEATGIPLKQELKAVRDEAGKRTESVSSMIVRRLVLNGPIDENIFELAPPPGSKIIEPPH